MQQNTYAQDLPTATFNRASAQSIREAQDICNTRGNEYADSWSLDNLKTPWLDNLLNDYPSVAVPMNLHPAYKRLIVLASMLDIKLSRLGGTYKPDTGLDSINYLGAYNTLRCEFDQQIEEYKQSPKPAVTLNGMYGSAGDLLRDKVQTVPPLVSR